MLIGYARVSTKDQDLTTQTNQLQELGCEEIFTDTISGIAKERPGLDSLMRFARKGDTVIVTKTDRIARNTIHALTIADELREKEVGFKLLDLGDVNINDKMGRMIYTVMSAFAEMERERIRERQREGYERARQEGRSMGRPKILTDDLVARIKDLTNTGLSQNKISQQLGISRPTVRKALSQ